MFFNLVLLNRQHKARFGIAWIAATRGVQYLPKRDVLEIDITKLCEEIIQQKATFFLDDLVKMLSYVSRPAVIIFPGELGSSGIIDTPPSPIIKKRGKKRRRSAEKDKDTPESQLEKLVANIRAQETGAEVSAQVELVVLQARVDEITLREPEVQRGMGKDVDEFGILGAFDPLEEDLLRGIAGPDKEVLPPLPSLEQAEAVPQPQVEGIVPLLPSLQGEVVPEASKKAASSTSSELDVGPVKITVQAQVHVSADKPAPPELPRLSRSITAQAQPSQDVVRVEEIQHGQVEPAVEAEMPAPTRPVLQQREVEVVELEDRQMQSRAARKKKKDEALSKLLIDTKPPRIVRINRCEPGEVEWTNISCCPLPQFKLKTPNLSNLLKMYLIRDDKDPQKRQQTSEGSSLRDSLALQRKSGRVTPPAELSGTARAIRDVLEERIEEQPIPEIQVTDDFSRLPTDSRPIPPLTASTPVTRTSLEAEQRTVEEVMAVAAAAREHLRSPRKRRRLFDVEPELSKDLDFITVPTELESRDLTATAVQEQETVGSVPLPTLTEQSRQQEIVNKIALMGRATLEDICQKPVNRLNIARAFSDILVLCRYNYVTLISLENSAELRFIERGPKMNR